LNDTIEELESLHADLMDDKCDLERIKQEEEEYYDAMPESFQSGSKGDAAQEAINNLQEAISLAEEVAEEIASAIESLKNVPSSEDDSESTAQADADKDVPTEVAVVAIVQDPEEKPTKGNFVEKWDSMRSAIEEAHSLLDLQHLRNQAEALRYAAKLAGESKDVVRKASEIKVRAERRAGELLLTTPKQSPGQYQQMRAETVATYAELGIDKTQAHRWQRIASIQPQTFETGISSTVEISTAGALQLAKEQKREQDAASRVPAIHRVQTGKYSVLLADPPWAYHDPMDKDNHWGGAINHYETISTDELCEFKMEIGGEEKSIPDIMETDSVLLLWTTAPMVPDALRVMQAWGYTYKTVAFTWVKKDANGKPTIGLGSYTRSNAEFCLLGVRGKGIPRMKSDIASLVESKKLPHSEKPPIVRDRIRYLFGDVPRLELFARQKVKGWDSFGNELPLCS
jgi:site-specific DNA-methyltransferase (adenine-specific)